jgi:phenylacetate-CoA ligase
MLKLYGPKYHHPKDLAPYQLQGLKRTVFQAYENSPFYRKRFEEAGVTPSDIKDLSDLRRLPFTDAEDLRSGYPFPLKAVREDQIVRVHSSSGTTGKRKILSYTQKDIDDWAYMFCRCYEMAGLTRDDRVQISVGYGLWTAGAGFQLGCERYGAMAIPVGPGNLDLQCEFLLDLRPTTLCATASMALLLAEEVSRRGLADNLALKRVICGAERAGPSMIARIKELFRINGVYDITGLTELYGPGTGLSCEAEQGIHYWADFYILEVINPDTLEPVKTGEIGEMVFTTLHKEASPLIRYRSRDLTRLVEGPCPCGCILPRHDKILGRSDDMFIIRGVNIYPQQIDSILSTIKGIGSEYQIILDRRPDGKDYMTLRIERGENVHPSADTTISETIKNRVKHSLMVSCMVDIVPYGNLPRSERKTKRVFDNRDL